jgi:hypothetical protein
MVASALPPAAVCFALTCTRVLPTPDVFGHSQLLEALAFVIEQVHN